MQIKFLGTRGEIKEKSKNYKNHSGILIDQKILIDFGEEKYLQYQPTLILITHFHPDHAFFIKDKNEYKISIPVYTPEKNKLIPNAKIITKKMKWNGYEITPVPTIHSVKIKSQGYLIKKGKKIIFYSGDMIWIEKKYHAMLKKINLVITEASYYKKGGMIRKDLNRTNGKVYGHAGIRELVKFFRKFSDKIIFTHFGSWFVKDVERGKMKIRLLKKKNVDIIPAHDGYVVKME